MVPLPSRETLENMKRADLQRLCKEYGVKANLKSEALIDLLLDTQSAPALPKRRSVSTRQSSGTGPSRTTSLIIHDTGDEQGRESDEGENDAQHTDSGSIQELPSLYPPRTRKAKDLQTRLGVGRPAAAGGSGARAFTKSMNLSRGKRAKLSKVLNNVEATIDEEPELAITNHANISHDGVEPAQAPEGNDKQVLTDPSPSFPGISEQIENAVRPLQAEIQSLKSEMQQVQQANVELLHLKVHMSAFSDLRAQIDSLATELRELRSQAAQMSTLGDEVKQLKENMTITLSPSLPSTPKPKSPRLPPGVGMGFPLAFKSSFPPTASGSTFQSSVVVQGSSINDPSLPHPGVAPSMLGKRQRDSGASSMAGVVEEGQVQTFSEEELSKQVLRPNKKRLKLSDADDETDATHAQNHTIPHYTIPRAPNFSVFSGPDGSSENYLDPPPPTTRLPDLFVPPSPPAGSSRLPSSSRNGQGATTSSAQNTENQHPFNFSFLPISSTPVNDLYMPAFPYPELPPSPSPAGPSIGGYLSRKQDERTDIFKSFGLPSPSRPRLRGVAAESQQQDGEVYVDPAALTRRGASSGKGKETTGHAVTTDYGRMALDPNNIAEPPPAMKTMYGTELEGDTRFGDFGVEGFASGFWAGGRL